MAIKEELYQLCQNTLREKIQFIQNTLDDLRNSAANETKSTAGDKHETALAMLQIEQENNNRQLKNLLEQALTTQPNRHFCFVRKNNKGSMVTTNKGKFFIAVGVGKLMSGNELIFAVSPQSPLGSQLLGRFPDDTVSINGTSYTIESFY